MIRAWLLLLLALLPVSAPAGERLRFATYDVGLARNGPGLLLADLRAEPPDPDIAAVVAVIRAARPDVLLISQFDHDLRGEALAALRARLASGPDAIDYPFVFAPPQNAGAESGLDLDRDGSRRGAGDALGWGRFRGHGSMALLSRLPIDLPGSHDFRGLRWRDLPGARMPVTASGGPFFDAETAAVLPLSSRSHWDVALVLADGGRLRVLASSPTPPLFDGPERLNQRRNADEIGFWTRYLDGARFPDAEGRDAALARPFVLLGDLNTDPGAGAGDRAAIAALLAHPALADPRPAGPGAPTGATAAMGDPALRLDYALPSRDLAIEGAGVVWPAPGEPLGDVVAAGPPHRLVWVDIAAPDRDPGVLDPVAARR